MKILTEEEINKEIDYNWSVYEGLRKKDEEALTNVLVVLSSILLICITLIIYLN